MNIAITGSSGFIGKYLVNALNESISCNKLILIDTTNGLNILDKNQLENIEVFDIIVHLAAKSYVPESFDNPYDFYITNIIGTLNILELCKKNNAKLIYLSSYVYGTPDYIPVDEKQTTKAFNPYGQSKIICESLCQGYNRDFGIPVIIFRPFNVYGDGQNQNFLIPSIIKQIIEGEKEIYLKDPYPKRDYIFINDVVSAIIKVLEQGFNSFEILNICSGESYSVKKVTEIINQLLKQKVNFKFDIQSQRKNEVNDTKGSRVKIGEFLNWEPKYSLEKGLKMIIDKYNL